MFLFLMSFLLPRQRVGAPGTRWLRSAEIDPGDANGERQSMKRGGVQSEGAGLRETLGTAAAAAPHSAGEMFATSFLDLQAAIREACERHTQWEARVVAGLRAVLEFAANKPAAARAVFVRARGEGPGERDRQDEVIAYFTELLEGVAPSKKRFPIADDGAIVESIATIVRAHLLGGTGHRLPDLAADLVYMTLMPYTGLEGAGRWAQSADALNPTGTGQYEYLGTRKPA